MLKESDIIDIIVRVCKLTPFPTSGLKTGLFRSVLNFRNEISRMKRKINVNEMLQSLTQFALHLLL